ncbi:MAG: hypothetical protein Q7J60_11375 [Bradyrhizobium sp.]|nr:hypothetical protein [Bradyrhizobium sp.]
MTNVKKFCEHAIAFLLASGSAAVAAYSMSQIAHKNLGIPSSDLRNQALMSAALLIGFVTVQFIVTRER